MERIGNLLLLINPEIRKVENWVHVTFLYYMEANCDQLSDSKYCDFDRPAMSTTQNRLAPPYRLSTPCLRSNKLLLNPVPRRRSQISSSLFVDDFCLQPASTVKFLGVLLDPHLSFAANVTHTTKALFLDASTHPLSARLSYSSSPFYVNFFSGA